MHRALTDNSELNLLWTETEYGKELKTPKTENGCSLPIKTAVVPTTHLQKNGSAHVISMLSVSSHICFFLNEKCHSCFGKVFPNF